jgi:hypothetical protein
MYSNNTENVKNPKKVFLLGKRARREREYMDLILRLTIYRSVK